jgi:hypothetical protein
MASPGVRYAAVSSHRLILCPSANAPDKDLLYRHNRGLAELWAWMHAKYPALIIEDCAGGSARQELTAAALTDTHWIFDNIRNRPNLMIMFGATYLFPAAPWSHWTVEPDLKDPRSLIRTPSFLLRGLAGAPEIVRDEWPLGRTVLQARH